MITIIRSKAVAVLLGPAGMGISALLQSTAGMIGQLTNFGLGTSAVKDIAHAHGMGNENEIGKTVAIFRRLVWLTGGLGFILTLLLAPYLSELAFDNRNYTIAFALISITLLLGQISSGQGVLLRGMRKLKYMATSSVLGALVGLVTSIPLYYFFGEGGIVPAIIVTSVTGLLLTWYFASRIEIKKISVDWAQTWKSGKAMLQLGFMLSLSGLITTGGAYLLRIFISQTGSISDVGLFNAGFAIVNGYVGMVFTAMSTDYYPRLSAVAHESQKWILEISQQAEIAILILGPILAVFMVFAPWGVIALYSRDFLPVTSFLVWSSLGIFFKAPTWAIGFIFLAKGASRAFFINELIVNIYMLGLNVAGYYYFGLTGLGISFLISYLLYFLQVWLVTKALFGFHLPLNTLWLFLTQLLLVLLCFLSAQFLDGYWLYSFGLVGIGIIAFNSVLALNKRIDLKAIIRRN